MRTLRSFTRFFLPLFIVVLLSSGTFARARTVEKKIYPRSMQGLRIFSGVDSVKMELWVDSVYTSLDLRARVGQLIMPIIYPRVTDTELLLARLKKEQWGGILFQKGMLADQRTLTIRLQQASPTPLLIALDGEWGLYMRLKDAPQYPRNRGLGDAGDLKLIEAYGAEVARQCQLMGIHINFAPVVDVNINPKNPVIGSRSFGTSPQHVAACALAYARGLEMGGVLSVAKHFPGHGDTHEDSHKTLPIVSASKARMKAVELFPFREYFASGFGGVMTAHLSVPSYDASGRAASLSKPITTTLLREEMGFRGLVFTDALEMKGAQTGAVSSVAVAALKAGNDILLGPAQPTQALDEILEAQARGELTDDEIEVKCRRVLSFKYALILCKAKGGVEAEVVKDKIWTPEEAQLRARLQQAAKATTTDIDPTARTKAMRMKQVKAKSGKR